MAVNNNRSGIVVVATVALLLLACSFWWMNRGYGEVSHKTYEFSKALYSACLKKSEEHLTKVEELFDEQAESLPPKERKWIKQMMNRARSGDWETAGKKAKRMLDDQIKY